MGGAALLALVWVGWTRVGFDPAEIADSVFAAFDPSGEFKAAAALRNPFSIRIFRFEGLHRAIRCLLFRVDAVKLSML